MLYIYNNSTDPYFNLAAEEYVLKNFTEDCFILWRNSTAVIIGKNQNALAEINLDYVKENNIHVVRRLSGGGAVFHDLGNVNFTFITNDTDDFVNFSKFTSPIIGVLNDKLDIKAELSGRNDLTINDQKFSGNAQYNYKNRVLHHGTLLFASSITNISDSLKVKPSKFEGKGVKSVKSRVTNISSHLKSPITIEDFISLTMDYVKNNNSSEGKIYEFTKEDISSIIKLRDEKYSTWEWNFGTSPKYNFINEKRFKGGTVELHFNVEKGIIKNCKIYGDFFSKKDVKDVEDALIGVKHNYDSIHESLKTLDIGKYFSNITIEDIMEIAL
ncbi:lipoate--protein ligase [Clostridium cylindrosporum]|uniref:lipoate--protein ligase n=1 Tax=Clostridium cylindrosporum DSM 605 TaxID=1121307 RepID=A0A0J8DBF2_CLOCY|nr:lipoate--protein ligase [Clostridium cylindrosporum]KMT21623.1 lipoate-protein ligase LplJ [Clostridium cylindrosporum DSM 605]